MNIETILNAMQAAYDDWCWNAEFISQEKYDKRLRQANAFRARILRTFAVCKSINADLLTEIEMLATYRNFAEANGFDEKQAWFWTDEWQAAEKEVDRDRIEHLENDLSQCVQWKDKQIAELVQRIAELEGYIDTHNRRVLKEI